MRFPFHRRPTSRNVAPPNRRRRWGAAGFESRQRGTLRLEPLEQRLALSVTAVRSGAAPNFTVTFVDSGSGPINNDLQLQINSGTNELEWGVNGGTPTNDLGGGDVATFADISDIVVQLGAGNDSLSWNLQTFAYNATISPDSGNPLNTNIQLEDTGSGNTVNVIANGTELYQFQGANNNDDLVVNPGAGDHQLRVDSYDGSRDRVTSDSIPEIRFQSLDTFTVAPTGGGTDVVSFATHNLNGAATYQTSLGSSDTLVIDGADAIADAFTVTNDAGQTVVTDNGSSTVVTNTSTDLGALRINGLGGDDSLTVDVNTTNPIGVPIFFDGGTGDDLLTVSGTPTGGVDEVIYTPGPSPGAGQLVYEDVGNTTLMSIAFANLAPVVDLVPAAALSINAGDADNAINYTQGSAATRGLITVDNQESIEFQNKTALFLNAGAGNDTVNLNNPNTPTSLTSITVNGGDPTASDTLIVNGTAGPGPDTITYKPTGVGVGAGDVDISGLPSIAFTTTEHLIVNGQGGGDTLAVDTTNLNGTQVFTPGAANDSGTLDFQDNALSSFIGTSLSFLGLGNGGLLSTADGAAGGARLDRFIYRGTDLSNSFSLAGQNASTGRITLDNQLPVDVSDMIQVTLAGLAGDDTFNLVNGPNGLPFDALTIDGGNPSSSDVVNFSGATGGVAVALADDALDTDSIVSGYGAPVTLLGVEVANLNTNGNALVVNGTSSAEDIEYTPTGPQAGTIAKAGVNTTFNFTNTAGALTIDPATADNSIVVNGTSANDTITVSQSGANVSVTVGGFKTMQAPAANIQSLVINGGLGNDTLTVDSTSGPVLVPIIFDSEDGNDTLQLSGGTAISDTYTVGPQAGSGVSSITFAGGTQTVHFQNLEPVVDTVPAASLTVIGTTADNAINYTQGSVAANGLVSVDNFESIEFSNKTALIIDAVQAATLSISTTRQLQPA